MRTIKNIIFIILSILNVYSLNYAQIESGKFKITGEIDFIYKNIQDKSTSTLFKQEKTEYFSLSSYVKFAYKINDTSKIWYFTTMLSDKSTENCSFFYHNAIGLQFKYQYVKYLLGYNLSIGENFTVLAGDVSRISLPWDLYMDFNNLHKINTRNFFNSISLDNALQNNNQLFNLNNKINKENNKNINESRDLELNNLNNAVNFGILLKKNNLKFGFNYISNSNFFVNTNHNNFDLEVNSTYIIQYKNLIELGATYIQDLNLGTIKYGIFYKYGQYNNLNTSLNNNSINSSQYKDLNIINLGIIANRNNFSLGFSLSYFGSMFDNQENIDSNNTQSNINVSTNINTNTNSNSQNLNSKDSDINNSLDLSSSYNVLDASTDFKSSDSLRDIKNINTPSFIYSVAASYTNWTISIASELKIAQYNQITIKSFDIKSDCKLYGFHPYIGYSISLITDQTEGLNKSNASSLNILMQKTNTKNNEKIKHLFYLGLKIFF